MRVTVVGASGNLGTGLLRRLRADGHAVVGVARRVPTTTPPAPYDVVGRWESVDVGSSGPDEPVVARLADAMRGSDAVVHLAWQIQPSHDRERLRRTNVDGTRRVALAAARAGVPSLVAVSSVGVYSPAYDDAPRDEDWPTGGVATSSYSVDKVAEEAVLDEVEGAYPDLAVARVRPALVFQRAAASGIERYFLGAVVPGGLVARGLPVLPWPAGVRVQAVHADDVASGLVAAVGRRGAFNLAAPDVLDAHAVADVLGARAVVPVPVHVVRSAVTAAWRVRGLHLSPGWVDLAASVPVLDTTRARTELGWEPRHSSRAALEELLGGLVDGAGTASPPMRPRARARRSLLGGQASDR